MADPTDTDDPTALPVGTPIDRYEVLDRLGSGGIATVYAARHVQSGSLYAIKVLTIDRASVRARAVREGEVQRSIRHPNVVAVTDVVKHRGAPALVMEYVAGPSLDQLLSRRRLSVPEVDALARHVLRGVARAHALGVVHRDLKPGNLLLHCTDDRIVAKVADFGIVKRLTTTGAGQTQAGVMMGTPPYMSPEQFVDSSTVDARGDVWALGVVLYEALTGRRPFEGDGTAELYARIVEGRYPALEGVPPRMIRAIAGALQPDRDRRWSNAATMLAAWRGERPDEASLGWDPETVRVARELVPDPFHTAAASLGPVPRRRAPMVAVALVVATALFTASAVTTAVLLGLLAVAGS